MVATPPLRLCGVLIFGKYLTSNRYCDLQDMVNIMGDCYCAAGPWCHPKCPQCWPPCQILLKFELYKVLVLSTCPLRSVNYNLSGSHILSFSRALTTTYGLHFIKYYAVRQ